MPTGRNGPIAILAGSGRLPIELVTHLERTRQDHRILAFRGFAARELRRRAHAIVDLLDLGRILRCLEEWSPAAVTLAGAVHRPSPAALLGAYSLLRNLQEVRDVISRGDDHVLRGAVSLLEERGHTVVGAHELAPNLTAPSGVLGRHRPAAEDFASIEAGLLLLQALSPFDVGQATVVAGQRVLAVEGPEGTDRMLRRARGIVRGGWLRPATTGGVLVKIAKKGQDLRVDMPAMGPRTVVEASKSGLRGLAYGAGTTLLLDQAETIATADRLGLYLFGIELEQPSSLPA